MSYPKMMRVLAFILLQLTLKSVSVCCQEVPLVVLPVASHKDVHDIAVTTSEEDDIKKEDATVLTGIMGDSRSRRRKSKKDKSKSPTAKLPPPTVNPTTFNPYPWCTKDSKKEV